MVGAFNQNVAPGGAYVFLRRGNSWSEAQKLSASDASQNSFFAEQLAFSGRTVVIGANKNDAKGVLSGAAYVFAPH